MHLVDDASQPPTPRAATLDVKHPRCPYCHDGIQPEHEKLPCLSCMAWHHRECAREHAACAACGEALTAAQRRSERPAPAPPARRSSRRLARRSIRPRNSTTRALLGMSLGGIVGWQGAQLLVSQIAFTTGNLTLEWGWERSWAVQLCCLGVGALLGLLAAALVYRD